MMLIVEVIMQEKQKIESGDNSFNYQINGNVVCGMSYTDVKQIVQDVFQQNFLQLRDEALREANKRAAEITELVLEKIGQIDSKLYNLFRDVNVQYGMYQLQKTYALGSNDDIRDMLADVMIERLKEDENEQGKIIYNEALKTMNVLTKKHLIILSIIFLMRYVGYNEKKEFSLCITVIADLMKTLGECKDDLMYEHLMYANCISYTGAFQYTMDNSIENMITEMVKIDPETKNIIAEMRRGNPLFNDIKNIWNNCGLSHFVLTSVGKAIAITYIRSRDINLPYSTYIRSRGINLSYSIGIADNNEF